MHLPKLSKKKKIVGSVALLALIVAGGLAYRFYPEKTESTEKGLNEVAIEDGIPQPLEKFEDFGLTVEKLNISAPIVPDVDGYDEKIYYGALKKGIAQFKDTSTPDKEGNLFVFGHSSFFKGVLGKYTEIFKELDKLQPDDEFLVYYKTVPYRYKVTKSFETKDSDWSIMDPTPKDTKDKTVTLMTCYPPGTTLKRWVVYATQI